MFEMFPINTRVRTALCDVMAEGEGSGTRLPEAGDLALLLSCVTFE